jgi:hypothetical protein
MDQGTDDKAIRIFACLPPDILSDATTPGCQLNVTFPSFFGDVEFKSDNCLYDEGRTSD